ncbi:MAG: EF-P beta-lysylation protein EpmB [Aureliella sp.]
MSGILHPNRDSVEGSLEAERKCPVEPAGWPESLKLAIRSGGELCKHLGLPTEPFCGPAEKDFPVFVPLEYLQRMRPGDPKDPLLLQVISSDLELGPGGEMDPVGDAASEISGGLLQKYQRRVLLIASGACAVHCRYCFRRNYPYEEVPKGQPVWEDWLNHIRNDSQIDEVILSGGDPLSVVDSRLAWFAEELAGINHVRRLRVHSRFPVVVPSRIDADLIEWVSNAKLSIYFVLHINHANELDQDLADGIARLRQAGATVLNQAVLLKGVNDSFEALSALCLSLVDIGVLPYYLHQLDLVRGGMHFAVEDQVAIGLMERLRAALPGYAVPKLVREEAGRASKSPL